MFKHAHKPLWMKLYERKGFSTRIPDRVHMALRDVLHERGFWEARTSWARNKVIRRRRVMEASYD